MSLASRSALVKLVGASGLTAGQSRLAASPPFEAGPDLREQLWPLAPDRRFAKYKARDIPARARHADNAAVHRAGYGYRLNSDDRSRLMWMIAEKIAE